MINSETRRRYESLWARSHSPINIIFQSARVPMVWWVPSTCRHVPQFSAIYQAHATFCLATYCTLVSCSSDFRPWRWMWYVPPKCPITYGLHGAITQKMAQFITVRASNLKKRYSLYIRNPLHPHATWSVLDTLIRNLSSYAKYAASSFCDHPSMWNKIQSR
jgi:hypothetical protein